MQWKQNKTKWIIISRILNLKKSAVYSRTMSENVCSSKLESFLRCYQQTLLVPFNMVSINDLSSWPPHCYQQTWLVPFNRVSINVLPSVLLSADVACSAWRDFNRWLIACSNGSAIFITIPMYVWLSGKAQGTTSFFPYDSPIIPEA